MLTRVPSTLLLVMVVLTVTTLSAFPYNSIMPSCTDDASEISKKTGYVVEKVEPYNLLNDGAMLQIWRRQTGIPLRRCTITHDQSIVVVSRVEDVRPHVRQLSSETEYLDYAALLRRFNIPLPCDDGYAYGYVLTFEVGEPKLDGRARSGHFSETDSIRWGIPTKPYLTFSNTGIVIRRPVVLSELSEGVSISELVENPFRTLQARPASISYLEESIGQDGSYSSKVLKVLEEGAIVSTYVSAPR